MNFYDFYRGFVLSALFYVMFPDWSIWRVLAAAFLAGAVVMLTVWQIRGIPKDETA